MVNWTNQADTNAVMALDAAVKQADGYEPVSNIVWEVANAEHVLAGCADDGRLVALAWVNKDGSLGARVHPEFRRQGLGKHLFDWALEKAQGAEKLIIRNESLTPEAEKLYEKYGFQQEFAENMLVFDLSQPVPRFALVNDLKLLPWNAETRQLFYKVYSEAFKERPGFTAPTADTWFADYEEDPDFLPDLSGVVVDGENNPLAFVTCGKLGTVGWVSQIGSTVRGRKLGHALLSHAVNAFKNAKFKECGLHVNVNNPRGQYVFESFGFRYRMRRARYVR